MFENIQFGGTPTVSDPAGLSLGAYVLPADAADASGIAWSVPSAGATSQESQPWWESVIKYGITRAIDNQFQQPVVSGNTQPGTFAGQNGATYQQTAVPTQPRVTAFKSADAASGGGLGLLVLVGIGALVVGG